MAGQLMQGLQFYDLFVTSVDKVGPLLKLWGQIDRQTSVLIEQMLLDMLKTFEQQNSTIPIITSLQPGLLCCAKYKDGIYYRAQIRNLKTQIPGTVEVRFIDYGNIETIQLENIRLFDDQNNNLKFIKPQATEFILAGVVSKTNFWDDESLEFVHHEIAYTEMKTVLVHSNPHYRLVKVIREDGTDLAGYLAAKGLVTPVSPQAIEVILRNLIGLTTPQMQQQITNRSVPIGPQFRTLPQKNQIPEVLTYKPELLPPNTEHFVYVSYVEDGPYLFSVQLQSMERVLEQLMQEINNIRLVPFTTPLIPGNPCLARCLEDNTICRGVVLNLEGDKCKTYYVDFGNTDMLPFSNIYQIPCNSLLPKVMSMRFTLNGLKNINVTNQVKCAFKDYVTNKLLKLKVLKSEDLIQYCELYDQNNKNVLEELYTLSGEYKSITMSKGAKHNVIVSYIEGCKKFFIQLKECVDSLNKLMLALAATSPAAPPLNEPRLNMACCAFYSGDNQWYRAKITSITGDSVTVQYIDYGNEETVPSHQLKTLDPKFITILPAQAVECCLLGYQNMSFNTEIENAFESLTLECEFTMKVMGKLNNTLLVDLFDSEGNNVAALLIEKLAAQKAQAISSPQILNNHPEHIRSFSPKDRSPKLQKERENWRSPENNKGNWREEKEDKNWRSSGGGEEKGGWRSNISPASDKSTNRSIKNNYENKPVNKRDSKNQKSNKKRDKNQWTDEGAKGESWDKPSTKPTKPNFERQKSYSDKSESSFVDDKKSYHKNEYQRKPPKTEGFDGKKKGFDKPKREFGDKKDFGDKNIGERNFGDKKSGDKTSGDKKFGDKTSGDKKFGDKTFGDKKFGDKTFGDKKFGDKTFGDKKFGDKTFGDKKFGDKTFGDKKFGDRTFGDKKSGGKFGEKDSSGKLNDRRKNSESRERNFDDRKPKTDKWGDSSSEKSWKSKKSDGDSKSKGGKSFGGKKDFSSPKREIPKVTQPLADLTEPFKTPEIQLGSNDYVAISWFYNPENFFCQSLASQQTFREQMVEIQNAYVGKKSNLTEIPNGSSVIAEFSEDSILYRATVLEKKGQNYKVQYVDFGNIGLVDASKIFQVEKRFMDLPLQSFRCGLSGVKSTDATWTTSQEIDNIFNKEQFLIVFENFDGDRYAVQLWDGDFCIKNQLVEAGLAKDGAAFEMDGEPTDINVLLGQNLRITISCVYSLQKFYVQFDKVKMTEIENAINSYNFETLQPLTTEAIVPEISCLVKLDDKKWCRAIILDNSNMDAISLSCPDKGNKIEASASNIYPLPPELCVYWYQAFECTLNNLNSDSCLLISDEKFKEDYENTELICYVDNIGESRLLVTLYTLTGEKIPLFEPDPDAYPTLEKICPFPVLTPNLTVFISHITNSDQIYLQKSSDSTIISDLLEKLYELYENDEENKPSLATFEQNKICSAKSNDGNWYRAKMISKETETTIKLHFIDYGNDEIVAKENIRELDAKFYNSELALCVSLNLETTEDFSSKFEELTSEKELKALVYYGETSWIAQFYSNDLNINQKLIELGVANEKPVAETYSATEKSSSNRASVTVTHVDSPTEFYVQLNANENDIQMLQLDLQEKIETLPILENAEPGSLCAARYTIDEEWYRAEVLDADSDITTVRFVDFGNTDVIDNTSESLKTLPPELLAIDKYAKKCSLNVVPKAEEWPQEAIKLFEDSINVELLFADIVYQDEKTKTYIELYDSDKNIAEILIESGYASRINHDHEDSLASTTGFISHFNSLSEFWLQLESSIPDLEMIVERLSAVETFPDLTDLSPGILCAANYPEDEMWYRARILSNTVAGVEVIFIDYGNSSTALKLKVLPEELIHMPALALKCSLNKPQGVDEWSEIANEKFQMISCDGATVFTVKKLAPGETTVVELFVGDNNIVGELSQLSTQTENVTEVAKEAAGSSELNFDESAAKIEANLEETEVEIEKSENSVEVENSEVLESNPESTPETVEEKILSSEAPETLSDEDEPEKEKIETGSPEISNKLPDESEVDLESTSGQTKDESGDSPKETKIDETENKTVAETKNGVKNEDKIVSDAEVLENDFSGKNEPNLEAKDEKNCNESVSEKISESEKLCTETKVESSQVEKDSNDSEKISESQKDCTEDVKNVTEAEKGSTVSEKVATEDDLENFSEPLGFPNGEKLVLENSQTESEKLKNEVRNLDFNNFEISSSILEKSKNEDIFTDSTKICEPIFDFEPNFVEFTSKSVSDSFLFSVQKESNKNGAQICTSNSLPNLNFENPNYENCSRNVLENQKENLSLIEKKYDKMTEFENASKLDTTEIFVKPDLGFSTPKKGDKCTENPFDVSEIKNETFRNCNITENLFGTTQNFDLTENTTNFLNEARIDFSGSNFENLSKIESKASENENREYEPKIDSAPEKIGATQQILMHENLSRGERNSFVYEEFQPKSDFAPEKIGASQEISVLTEDFNKNTEISKISIDNIKFESTETTDGENLVQTTTEIENLELTNSETEKEKTGMTLEISVQTENITLKINKNTENSKISIENIKIESNETSKDEISVETEKIDPEPEPEKNGSPREISENDYFPSKSNDSYIDENLLQISRNIFDYEPRNERNYENSIGNAENQSYDTVDAKITVSPKIVPETENLVRIRSPKIPLSEKIVPGAISRGDLSELENFD